MTIDILCLAFVILLALFGWKRGLISQLVTIGTAVLLWFSQSLWLEPVGAVLGRCGPALAENIFLRELTGFLLLYLSVVLITLLIERKVIKKYGPLRWSNHWLGALLGTAKGILYAAVFLWILQATVLWKKPPADSGPPWLAQSTAIAVVGPWNPIRMFTLRELVDEMKHRSAERAGNPESSPRVEALRQSDLVRSLLEAARNDREWGTTSYRKLASNPLVQDVVREPGLRELLFGN